MCVWQRVRYGTNWAREEPAVCGVGVGNGVGTAEQGVLSAVAGVRGGMLKGENCQVRVCVGKGCVCVWGGPTHTAPGRSRWNQPRPAQPARRTRVEPSTIPQPARAVARARACGQGVQELPVAARQEGRRGRRLRCVRQRAACRGQWYVVGGGEPAVRNAVRAQTRRAAQA